MRHNRRTSGPWTNMACIGRCYPRQHHYPGSIEEVAALVRRFKQTGERCRVAGGGKSPNSCTFTDGHLIHMSRLNRILSVDRETQTIVCEGGAVMRDVFERLSEHDLMLRCVPSYVQTTIAGVVATATHGSGVCTRSLCDYVVKLVFVDGNGDLRTFDKSTPKELSLAACHLGMLGVVVQVTLQAEKRQMWRVRSAPVSLHTLTDGDTLARRVSGSEFYRFFWMPNTDFCYESVGTCIDDTMEKEEKEKGERGAATARAAASKASPALGSVSRTASRGFVQRLIEPPSPREEASGYQAWLRQQRHPRVRACRALKGNWLRHGVVEAALAAATICPGIQPYINQTYRRLFYDAPEVLYGTSLECFTFDCLFKQWACEWAVDATKALDAFKFLRELIRLENLSVHFPVEFRFTDADTTAISPAHGRKTCWIGIVMYRPYQRHARDTLRYYQAFSDAMTAMGGRPHWAKYYTWGPVELRRAYGQNWDDFLQLRRTMDPCDIFVNGWWKSLSGSGQLLNSTISHL